MRLADCPSRLWPFDKEHLVVGARPLEDLGEMKLAPRKIQASFSWRALRGSLWSGTLVQFMPCSRIAVTHRTIDGIRVAWRPSSARVFGGLLAGFKTFPDRRRSWFWVAACALAHFGTSPLGA